MPRKPAKQAPTAPAMDFGALVDAIRQVHEHTAAVVNRVVNTSLTLRNWVIGAYIVEYQLRGADRAEYGNRIMEKLAAALQKHQVPTCDPSRLYAYATFFRAYPQVQAVASQTWPQLLAMSSGSRDVILRTVSGKLEATTDESEISRTLSGKLGGTHSTAPDANQIVGTLSPRLANPGEKLMSCLSYSHFELLSSLDAPLKRAFYEIECIRGNWSVRALKRQIASLYFERSGLSLDKEKLSAMANDLADTAEPKLSIRDPYIFEFLGLKPHETMGESDLENGLLENLQEFLLEMGHGFCLEARQKSIIIGETRGFVDLVFYHRILKCHVLVELKVDEFRHEHIGQLNTYVAWYQKNMMQEGDNPPVGLLLCTGKDHALVEYALSSMTNRLFVSKYQLELPSKEALQSFIDTQRKEVSGEI
ncbi:hypothetical protein BH11VER1_BH11VER1_02950 [soil metagenome]